MVVEGESNIKRKQLDYSWRVGCQNIQETLFEADGLRLDTVSRAIDKGGT